MPLIRKPPPLPAAAPPDEAGPGLLTTGSGDERWAAARRLASHPEAAPILGAALQAEQDGRVRDALFTSLACIGGPEGVVAVLPCLRSDDASLRTGALDALKAMGEAVAPHLQALLGDPDADVRILACDLARQCPQAEAAALLCVLLDREDAANVCAAAVEVLAETGGPAVLPALARCAERFAADPFLTFSIRVAAERIGAQGPAPA